MVDFFILINHIKIKSSQKHHYLIQFTKSKQSKHHYLIQFTKSKQSKHHYLIRFFIKSYLLTIA